MLGAFGGGRNTTVLPLAFPATRATNVPPTPSTVALAGSASLRKQKRGRRPRVQPEDLGAGPGAVPVDAVHAAAVRRVRPGSASTIASARYAATMGVPQTVRSVRLDMQDDADYAQGAVARGTGENDGGTSPKSCPRAGRLHAMESFAVVDKDGYGVVVSPVAAPTALPPSRPAHIDRDMTLTRWGWGWGGCVGFLGVRCL